MNIFEMKQAS